MNRETEETQPAPAPWAIDLLILIAALAGFAVHMLLLVRHFTDASLGIAGCGEGSGCEEILTSRWSQIFHIPVPAIGMLVYLGLMFSLTPRGHRLLAPMLGAITGAGFWFLFVMILLMRKFCPWCMTAHVIGAGVVLLGLIHLAKTIGISSAVRKLLLWAALAFFGISLAQLYGPLPVTHRIDAVMAPAVSDASGIHAHGEGRKVSFADGKRAYNVNALPHIGRDDAKHVIVEYFDYQCPACRTMRGYLKGLLTKHPQDICLIVLPVPLDGQCNRSLGVLGAHPGSCEFTRLALAVWKSNPAGFPAFHEKALSDGSLENARKLARAAIPADRFDAALSDPWIEELIQADIADWVDFSSKTPNLPKLLITGKRILHGLPSGEADFIRVMEEELGL